MTDFVKGEFCRRLDEKAKENSIVCVQTMNIIEKQIALNHMIKKGWICVENKTSCTKSWIYFTLTFADKDAAASFKV